MYEIYHDCRHNNLISYLVTIAYVHERVSVLHISKVVLLNVVYTRWSRLSLSLTHDVSANTVSSAVIRWDPPSSTGGGGISITKYRIMSSDNGLSLNVTVDDMTYTITGLQYNTDYSVEVTAINSCGLESEPASEVVNIEARG